MFINDPPRPQTRKELKVNLPAKTHSRLRALQVESGREAPVLVAEALGLYFAKLAEQAQRDERAVLSVSVNRGRTSSYGRL